MGARPLQVPEDCPREVRPLAVALLARHRSAQPRPGETATSSLKLLCAVASPSALPCAQVVDLYNACTAARPEDRPTARDIVATLLPLGKQQQQQPSGGAERPGSATAPAVARAAEQPPQQQQQQRMLRACSVPSPAHEYISPFAQQSGQLDQPGGWMWSA